MCEVIYLPSYRLRERMKYNTDAEVINVGVWLQKKYSKPKPKEEPPEVEKTEGEDLLREQMEENEKRKQRLDKERVEETKSRISRRWQQPIA